jgi:uncharacterized protein YdeI (YjbR/CyaY-like superfamily)
MPTRGTKKKTLRRAGARTPDSSPRFFAAASQFRRWLERHHGTAAELWVGYHKKATGLPSITWPESVDEALCFGWIDGVRKSIDEHRYAIRFTPRRSGSTWSAVNLERAAALIEAGRMHAAGLAAHQARREDRTSLYSFEQQEVRFAPQHEARLRRNRAAWTFWQAQPPGYRRTATWWVESAKQEETRLRRLERLIADCAAQRRIAPLARKKK